MDWGETQKGVDPSSGVRGDEPSRMQGVDQSQELQQLVAVCGRVGRRPVVVRRGRVCGKHGWQK